MFTRHEKKAMKKFFKTISPREHKKLPDGVLNCLTRGDADTWQVFLIFDPALSFLQATRIARNLLPLRGHRPPPSAYDCTGRFLASRAVVSRMGDGRVLIKQVQGIDV